MAAVSCRKLPSFGDGVVSMGGVVVAASSDDDVVVVSSLLLFSMEVLEGGCGLSDCLA